MNFEQLLTDIKMGKDVPEESVLSYLTVGSKKDRAAINLLFSEAYANSSKSNGMALAEVFAERAWELSGFEESYFDSYFILLKINKNTSKAKQALRTMGLIKSKEADVIKALEYFNKWQYVFPIFEMIDNYVYDYFVLDSISELASKFRVNGNTQKKKTDKIKLVFLVPGVTQFNNIVTRENHYIISNLDKNKFEVAVIITERTKHVLQSKQGTSHIEKFKNSGAEVFISGDGDNYITELILLAKKVVEYNPDLFIASEILSDFYYFFFSLLLPKSIKTFGLSYSLPALSISPYYNHAIVSMRHPLLETPVDVTFVDMETELPKLEDIRPIDKSELNLPENSVVMVSSGRYNKYQNINYWQMVFRLLRENENLFFLLIGSSRDYLPILESCEKNISKKIVLVKWTEYPENYLAIGDIYIDSYPSGGGLTIKEASALEIPVVSFEHNFFQRYDPRDVSIGGEFISNKQLLVPRGDFNKFYEVVSELINDSERRKEIGKFECNFINTLSGNPKRMVRKYEEVFIKVINNKIG